MAQKEISLLYITERILVLTFPSDDDENAYRSSLRHVSRMLRTKHGYNYKIFNNSRKRRDLAILNPGVVEFGWPEDLAPPLERLCSICKEIDNWITADKNHLVVLHENGGACSEDLALDRFAMKKFFSEQNVLPSQKRYVNYFAGLLSNEIRINSNPIYLYQVVVYGIPRVSKLYIKIYEKMVPTFMSAVYKATSPILTIRLNPPVMLRGDVVFKCFAQPHHLLFRCQFNTCAVDASTSSCFSFISRDLDDIGYEDAGLDLLFSFNRDVPMIGDASSSTTSIADSSQEDDDDDDIRSKRSNSYENFDSFAEDDATTSLTNIEPVNGNPFPPIQRERELSANDTADSGIHSVVDGDTEQVEVVEIENQGKKLSISSAKDQINGGTKSGEYRGVSNDAAKSSTEPQQPKVERKVRDRQPEEVVMYASLRNNNNNNMKEAENMVQNEIQENGTSPHTPDYSHHRPPPVTPPSKRTFSPLLMRPTSPVADDSRKIDPDLVATDRYDPQSRAFSYVPKQALQDHFKAPKKPTQLVHTVERTTRSTPSSPPPTEEFPFYEREQTGSGIIKPKTSLQGPLSSSDIDQLLDPNFYLNFTDDDSHFAQNQFSHLPASSSTGVQPHFSEGAAETKPLPPTSPSLANNDFYSSVSTPKTPKTPPPVMAKPTRRLDPAEESLLRDLEEYDPHRTRAPQPHVPHQQLDVHAAPASVGRPPESLYIQNRTWSPAVAPPSTPISRQVAPSPVASIQSVDSMRSPSSPRKVYHQEPRWEDALNDVPQFTAIRSTPIQEKVQSTPVQEQMRGTPLLDKMRATPLQEKSRSTPVQQEPMQQDLPYASYQQTIREQPYPSSYESKPRPSALTQQSMGSPMVQRVSHVVHSAPPASRREDPFSKLHYGLKMDSPPRYADSFDDSYVEPIYTKPLVRKAQSVPNNYSATAPWLEDEREGSIDPWLESQREKLRLRRELNDPDMLRRREQEKLLLEELKHVHDERMTRFNKREADYTVEGFGVRAEEEQHLVPEPEFIVLKREIIENPADLPPRTLLMRQWSDSATSQQYASQHQPIYLTNDRLSANRPNGRDRSPPSPNEMSSRLSNKSPFQRSAAPVSTTWRSPSAPPDRPTDFSRLQDILWDAEYSRNATTPTPSLSKVSSPKSILKKPKSADSQTSIGVQASSTPNRFFNGYREQVDSPSSRVFDLEPAQPPQSGDNFDSTQGYRPETPSSAYRPETPAFPRMRGETPLPYHPLLYSDFDKNMVNPSSAMAPTSARNTSLMVRSPSPASQYYAQSRRSSLTSLVEPMDVVNQHPVFVKDTSKYWYKPNISRDEAISILKDKPPGTFIMRDSNSFPGAFGLALKVATPPPGVQTKSNDGSELVRHFLIEPTAKGVKLKGCNNEPVFGSLAALVYQHSITPLALPCKLLLPDYDPGAIAGEHPNTAQALLEQGAACNVTYLFSCDTESLTGPEAVRRAIDQALTMAQQKQLAPISVHFKVASAGITITDISRKLFFRRHYPVNHVTFCGIDPDDRRWNAGVGSQPSRIFGFVARKIANRTENACHIFAEFEPEQPATAIVNFVTKVMMAPLHSNLSSSSSTSMR